MISDEQAALQANGADHGGQAIKVGSLEPMHMGSQPVSLADQMGRTLINPMGQMFMPGPPLVAQGNPVAGLGDVPVLSMQPQIMMPAEPSAMPPATGPAHSVGMMAPQTPQQVEPGPPPEPTPGVAPNLEFVGKTLAPNFEVPMAAALLD